MATKFRGGGGGPPLWGATVPCPPPLVHVLAVDSGVVRDGKMGSERTGRKEGAKKEGRRRGSGAVVAVMVVMAGLRGAVMVGGVPLRTPGIAQCHIFPLHARLTQGPLRLPVPLLQLRLSLSLFQATLNLLYRPDFTTAAVGCVLPRPLSPASPPLNQSDMIFVIHHPGSTASLSPSYPAFLYLTHRRLLRSVFRLQCRLLKRKDKRQKNCITPTCARNKPPVKHQRVEFLICLGNRSR